VDGFAVWYGVIFLLGLETACGVSRRHAIMIVLFLWSSR
jgi:hypothetical protein